MRLATLAVGVLLVAAPVALASHPDRFFEAKANLDADPALERVRGEEGSSVDHKSWYGRVSIIDVCGGKERVYRVTRSLRHVVDGSVVQADGRGRREVLGVVTGAEREGQARLVRLVGRRGVCQRMRELFEYDMSRPPQPPPPAFELTSFTVEISELEPRFAGREIRLIEQYQLAGMLSSRQRESLYRYVRARDLYVRYRTTLRTIP